MIGQGRFHLMTREIDGPAIPQVGQVAFDRLLHRACGCGLVWHRMRRCFVVCRDRGRFVNPVSYTDLGPSHWPLSSAMLPHVVTIVRWADAKLNGDWIRMMEIANRVSDEASRDETHRFVMDRFPDFWADFNRLVGRAEHGKDWGRKYFDLGVMDGAKRQALPQ